MRSLAVAGVLCALLLCAAHAHQQVPNAVRAGFFPGRSGNMVVAPTELNTPMVRAFFIDPEHAHFGQDAWEEAPISDLSNMAKHALGLHAAAAPSALSTVQQGAPALANVMVTVDGMPADTIAQFAQLSAGDMQSTQLRVQHFPATPLSVAASLQTATTPALHGIVGSSWTVGENQQVSALDAARVDAACLQPTLADAAVAQSSGAMVVSVSADPQTASVQCPQHRTGSQAAVACMARAQDGFAAVDTSAQQDRDLTSQLAVHDRKLLVQLADPSQSVLSVIQAANEGGVAMTLDRKAHLLTVDFLPWGSETTRQVTYSLDVPEERGMLLELQYAWHVAQTAAGHSQKTGMAQTHGGQPHLWFFTLSQLRPLSRRYGAHSLEVAGASCLAGSLALALQSRVRGLYPQGAAVAEVLLVPAEGVSQSVPLSQQAAIQQALSATPATASAATEFLPRVYVTARSGSFLQQACAALSNSLAAEQKRVYCPDIRDAAVRVHPNSLRFGVLNARGAQKGVEVMSAAAHPRSVAAYLSDPQVRGLPAVISSFAKAGVSAESLGADPTPTEVERYQIVLWLSIILGFTVLAAAWALAYMPFKKDPLVYGSFRFDGGSSRR